jgi:S-adenosylmethionine:tRNA ribosyltransferase-isomerase
MLLSELDFDLPESLIARFPADRRGESRLLVHECESSKTQDRQFRDLPNFLREGDLLVLNNTAVVPARLLCKKPTGGKVEGLWLSESIDGNAECMLSGGRLRPGVELQFEDGISRIRLLKKLRPGFWRIENLSEGTWQEMLAEFGCTPLPPYIRRLRRELGENEDSALDRERYQTIWADARGSVAAPTASLHFNSELMEQLSAKGVQQTAITLHVGQGTFLPVEEERVENHNMHAEQYEVDAAAATAIEAARREGRRIICAGTTVCRVLESLEGSIAPVSGRTNLFILPGHCFRWVDALLTNFHTPKSTLLAMLAAFFEQNSSEKGIKGIQRLYQYAISKEYRFFSYGDASLWLP